MADEQDLLDVEQPQVSAPMPAPRFNQDINLGPTISDLPNPVYQPTEQEARFRNLTDTLRNIPIRSVSEAMSAINLASQLEGRLGLDADLKAGRPPQEAIARWAPKLFMNNPRQLLEATKKPFQPNTMQVGGRTLIQTSPNRYQISPQDLGMAGPIIAEPAQTPEGEVIPNLKVVRGKSGAVHFVPQGKGGPTDIQLGTIIKHQLDDIGLQLRDAEEGSAEEKALKEDQKKWRAEFRKVTEGVLKSRTPSPKPATPNSGGIPTVMTQEQYDALPSGAIYLNEKNNRKHRKP